MILLIITGITLNFALGENGLIKSAQNARELAEIDDETSAIKRASLAALIRTKANDISKDELDKSLEGEFGSRASYTLDEDENLYIVNITKSKRSYLVDKEGNVSSRGKWGADYTTGRISINGEEVKSGNVYLEIGDTIAGYDPTDGAEYNEVISYGESTEAHPSANGYADTVFRLQAVQGDNDKQTVSYDLTKGWKLLGVTSSGNLIITTTDVVRPVSVGETNIGTLNYHLKGRTGYKYVIEELNRLSMLYGQGKLAISSRSIKVEDVNKITGYNPENIDGNGTHAFSGEMNEYGNTVTYSWEENNQRKPTYKYEAGMSVVENKLTSIHDRGFIWFNEKANDWSTPIAKEQIGTIITLTSSIYSYSKWNFSASRSKSFNMIFVSSYYTASRYISLGKDNVRFCMIHVGNSGTDWSGIADSKMDEFLSNYAAIRPVVILDNNININYTNGVWTVSAEEN